MGYIDIEAEDIYKLENRILVDIRSPQEYREFHIPGAINVPLFENDEKKLIGYIYRTQGVEKAKEVGENIARRKLEEFYRIFKELKEKHSNVVVYCWRGGMRSKGMCEAMSRLGLELLRLRGGYRAYRQFMLRDMEHILETVRFIVLTGRTGVGKTKVLNILKEEGYPVIDLESLAQDRGSVFGNVGISQRVSQKMFESMLYEELRKLKGKFVFIEDESRRVGNIHIPDALWRRKEQGVYVEITADIKSRVRNILEDYTRSEGWQKEVLVALSKIRKYLGPQRHKEAVELLKLGNYPVLVEFLIREYYDKRYKLFGKPVTSVDCTDIRRCVDRLKDFYHRLSHEGKVPNTSLHTG